MSAVEPVVKRSYLVSPIDPDSGEPFEGKYQGNIWLGFSWDLQESPLMVFVTKEGRLRSVHRDEAGLEAL